MGLQPQSTCDIVRFVKDQDASNCAAHVASPNSSSATDADVIASELIGLGMLICIVSTLLNAIANNRLSESQVVPLIPGFVPVAAARDLIGGNPETAMLKHRLTLGTRLLTAWLSSAGALKESCPITLSTIADAWRKIAAVAIEVLENIPVSGISNASLKANWSGLLVLLTEATGGGTPCIDEDGTVNIPGWAERRKGQRQACSVSAVIHSAAGDSVAEIQNISKDGAGLKSNANLVKGDTILVTGVGLSRAGTVQWADGNRFGLRWEAHVN